MCKDPYDGPPSPSRSRNHQAIWLVAAFVGAIAFFPSALHAQVRVQKEQWNRGYHGLAEFFRRLDLETVREEEWRRVPAQKSVLIALGSFSRYPRDLESYVRQGGAVLVATDRGQQGARKVPGIRLWDGPVEAVDPGAALQDFRDCPIVASIEDHPLTRNVSGIATNRPGWFYDDPDESFADAPWRVLARLPEVEIFGVRSGSKPPFLAALQTPSGGRAVVVADQSVFANQMLLFEDNLRFLGNVASWLGEGRTTVLLLEDRSFVSPPAPEEVEVDIPPPTPEEVRDALRQLPPEVLVPFANAVLASMEDAGIPDELVTFLVQQIPPLHYRRLLLLIATFCLGLVAFRKLISESVAEEGEGESEAILGGRTRRRRAKLERQEAARELLERFRAEVAETSSVPWPVFASRLRLKDARLRTWLMRIALRDAGRRLDPKHHRWWTRRRLRNIYARINSWRRLRAAGDLEYKA